ncbi:MAG: methyltransferase domain-containing protein, partial [Verrucomicrobia bacterium]|nr:methyltransferase domain-containing protein [Verrucomicrobiota bacterium]
MTIATSRTDLDAVSCPGVENPYETRKLLSEYLLFHYGTPAEVLPFEQGPREALGYPVRCVRECLELASLPEGARALDLGCAVGASSFELARYCEEVIGIDFSHNFIAAAESIRLLGALAYDRAEEGDLSTPLVAKRPEGVLPGRVCFEQGDAMRLRDGLGRFDVVLMANLIDRLREPKRCLSQLAALVRPGGTLVITSPYTWMEAY